VLCPLHQNAFRLDTGCSTTGTEPLNSYDVQIDNHQNIILRTSAR
jgi:nitrite reductase (NADH) small subunit